MFTIGTIITIACALVAATDEEKTKNDALRKIATDFKTLELDDLAFLNSTAQTIGVNKDLIAKLSGLVSKNLSNPDPVRDRGYNAYDDGNDGPKIGVIEESPDYASSVVLASDLLSLTSAVAAVKEKSCREQGYKFLDGLLTNKRWALKSEYSISNDGGDPIKHALKLN